MNKKKKNKFRSKFEEQVFSKVSKIGLYESEKVSYIQPAVTRHYTSDIVLKKKDGTKMFIEVKGRFRTGEERKKYILIKNSNPDLDLRFVFMNPNQKLRKNTKTTYKDWAEKNNFLWAKKEIPDSWINECI